MPLLHSGEFSSCAMNGTTVNETSPFCAISPFRFIASQSMKLDGTKRVIDSRKRNKLIFFFPAAQINLISLPDDR
jgi:hypothetical protein